MRRQNWLFAFGLALGSLCIDTAAAQTSQPAGSSAPSGQFSFMVCNKTTMNFYFAFISGATSEDAQYRLSGWWQSSPGPCHSPGNFAQGRFYYFGYNFVGSSRNVLEGTAVMQCLPYDFTSGQATNFNQIIVGDAHCDPFPTSAPYPPGKYLEGFVELIIPSTRPDYCLQLTSTQQGECPQ
jgi:uncharacterized membrane protein